MMRYLLFLILAPAALWPARIVLPNVTVGRNLQAAATLALDEAPDSDLAVTLTSANSGQMLLSTSPERAGAPSIRVTVRAGSRLSPEFYIQGLHSSGEVAYTAVATGCGSSAGTVTLAPSGIIFARSGSGTGWLRTTTGANAEINLQSAVLDAQLNYVSPQFVAGGMAVRVAISSSNPGTGAVHHAAVAIAGGSGAAVAHFQPAAPGTTTLTIDPPPGFAPAAEFATLAATVIMPGIAMADEVAVGQNLQVEATVTLGEPAPAGGLEVTISSEDASRLLVSRGRAEVGHGSVSIRMPAGATSASYFLQAIGNTGTVATKVTAVGYRERTGMITLAHSGLVIGGPPGPPDEAELFRKDAADAPHGFMVRLAEGVPVPLLIYSVQLDPLTGRSADLTVQAVRAGMSLTAALRNSNPAVGKVRARSLTIQAGSHTAVTEFIPLSAGSTEISLDTPEGFKKSANATALTVIVK
jgi:hypothetical protein